MQRQQIFSIVLLLSAVNGMTSPYVAIVWHFRIVWLPIWGPPDPSLVLYLAMLITATTTLLVSGVPAALVEGALPKWRASAAAMWIWAGAALVLCVLGLLARLGAAPSA